MSRRAEQWVWDHSGTTGNDRMILAYMGNEANDEGFSCFPSVERIADKCRLSKNTVLSVLGRLERIGELVIARPAVHGRGHHNRYALVLGRDPGSVLDQLKGEKVAPFRGPGKGSVQADKRRDLRPEKVHSDRAIPVVPIDIPAEASESGDSPPLTMRQNRDRVRQLKDHLRSGMLA